MKKSVLIISFIMISLLTKAQIFCQGSSFEFKNGITEWSEPIQTSLITEKMQKKGLAAVPVEFRIKATKRVAMACHYEVQVKNLSTTDGIEFSAYNNYTDATGKTIYEKVKLKAGETTDFKIVYSELGCKVKEVEDCTNCGWTLQFAE